MKISRREVFEELEPPPGGAARLRRRLERERVRPGVPRALLPMTAAATAVAATIVWLALGSAPQRTRLAAPEQRRELAELLSSHPATVALGMASNPAEPVVVREDARQRYAVTRVATPSDDVVFYWVASSEEPKTDLQRSD